MSIENSIVVGLFYLTVGYNIDNKNSVMLPNGMQMKGLQRNDDAMKV